MIYVVEVNFNGMIGYTGTYRVEANSESKAREMALKEAAEDLDVESVEVEK